MIRLLMSNDWHRHWNFILHVTVSGAFVANIWIWNTSVDFLIDVLVSDLRLLMGQGTAGVIILLVHNEPSDSHSDIFGNSFYSLISPSSHLALLPIGGLRPTTSKVHEKLSDSKGLTSIFSPTTTHFLRRIRRRGYFSFTSFPMLFRF